MASDTHAIVFAVNCPPQAPALGHATNDSFSKSARDMLPVAYFPKPSYTSTTVTSFPLNLPGKIEPP